MKARDMYRLVRTTPMMTTRQSVHMPSPTAMRLRPLGACVPAMRSRWVPVLLVRRVTQ